MARLCDFVDPRLLPARSLRHAAGGGGGADLSRRPAGIGGARGGGVRRSALPPAPRDRRAAAAGSPLTPGPRRCEVCGSTRFLCVDHRDGDEQNDAPDNLRFLCKSCNTRLGLAMARAGQGRRVRQYNPAILDGLHTEDILPHKTNWAQKIDKPPFCSWAVTGGITFTFGGLKINTSAQVLDTEGRVIPGLYAAGNSVGFWYHNYPGGGAVTAADCARHALEQGAELFARHACNFYTEKNVSRARARGDRYAIILAGKYQVSRGGSVVNLKFLLGAAAGAARASPRRTR